MTTKSMSSSMELKPLTAESSREEELFQLHLLSDNCKPGSFLGDFFTKPMMEWIEQHIKDDTSTDLMADYLTTCTELAVLKKEYKQQADQFKSDLEHARAMYQQEVGISENNRKNMDYWLKVASERMDEIHDLQGKLAATEAVAADEKAAQAVEIMRLKAEIYDLTHKEA